MIEKPPMEWIDKLFNCMQEFYKERWTKNFTFSLTESLYKTMWQSALTGLTHEQIRGVLVYLKRAAQDPRAIPPNHLEFFRYARGDSKPVINYEADNGKRCDPAVANRAMDEIYSKLGRSRALSK